MPLIFLALFAVAGVAFAASKASATPSVSNATSGTPVTTPAKGTPVPAPVNQTGVTQIPLDQATSAVNTPHQKKPKKKK